VKPVLPGKFKSCKAGKPEPLQLQNCCAADYVTYAMQVRRIFWNKQLSQEIFYDRYLSNEEVV